MLTRLSALAVAIQMMLPPALSAAAPGPLGGEFQVNSYTTSYQQVPHVAADPAGNFLVVWASFRQDGSEFDGAFGQRYDSGGTPQGPEFQVNTYTTHEKGQPAVAADAAGNFVVVWQSFLQSGSGFSVFGQRYDAGGVPQGSEFQVNTSTTASEKSPAIAADAAGNF